MDYLINGVRYKQEACTQDILEGAYKSNAKALCLCGQKPLPLTISKKTTNAGRPVFSLRRLANTGALHDNDCKHYTLPDFLKGETKNQPQVAAHLTNEALLAIGVELHSQSGFHKWRSRMAGKRRWSLLSRHFKETAGSASFLTHIPEGRELFVVKGERHIKDFQADPTTPFIAVGCVEAITEAKFGFQITLNASGIVIYIDEPRLKVLEGQIGQSYSSISSAENNYLLIAEINLTDKGFARLLNASVLKMTSESWLCFEDDAQAEIIQKLVASGAQFDQLSLSADLPRGVAGFKLANSDVVVLSPTDDTPQIREEVYSWLLGASHPCIVWDGSTPFTAA